jgi:hypothetical protein
MDTQDGREAMKRMRPALSDMDWTGMGWAGMDWTGKDWTGAETELNASFAAHK